MNNKLISKQAIALFIAATFGGITLTSWLNANAQTTTPQAIAPKYTPLQDAKDF